MIYKEYNSYIGALQLGLDKKIKVISMDGCEGTGKVIVTNSNLPYISNIKINNNSIKIIDARDNKPFEYSLDLIHWQYFHIFNNLEGKKYNAYIKNRFGCISEPNPFVIINIPNAITPTNYGFNDALNIKELENYPGSRIRIFNRTGKILIDKNFTNNPVWDWKHQGRPVETASY